MLWHDESNSRFSRFYESGTKHEKKKKSREPVAQPGRKPLTCSAQFRGMTQNVEADGCVSALFNDTVN